MYVFIFSLFERISIVFLLGINDLISLYTTYVYSVYVNVFVNIMVNIYVYWKISSINDLALDIVFQSHSFSAAKFSAHWLFQYYHCGLISCVSSHLFLLGVSIRWKLPAIIHPYELNWYWECFNCISTLMPEKFFFVRNKIEHCSTKINKNKTMIYLFFNDQLISMSHRW